MGFEKPISTIRKAIKNLAGENATKEGLSKPEQRHFDDALNAFKIRDMIDPDGLEASIEIRARLQEIKDTMGDELYNFFSDKWVLINNNSKSIIDNEVDIINKNNKTSQDEKDIAIDEFLIKFIREKALELYNDPQIISSFKDKKEILSEGLYGMMLSMLQILRSNKNNY